MREKQKQKEIVSETDKQREFRLHISKLKYTGIKVDTSASCMKDVHTICIGRKVITI